MYLDKVMNELNNNNTEGAKMHLEGGQKMISSMNDQTVPRWQQTIILHLENRAVSAGIRFPILCGFGRNRKDIHMRLINFFIHFNNIKIKNRNHQFCRRIINHFFFVQGK